MKKLHMKAFGGLAVTAVTAQPLHFRTDKIRALLIYLALEGERPLSTTKFKRNSGAKRRPTTAVPLSATIFRPNSPPSSDGNGNCARSRNCSWTPTAAC